MTFDHQRLLYANVMQIQQTKTKIADLDQRLERALLDWCAMAGERERLLEDMEKLRTYAHEDWIAVRHDLARQGVET